MSDEPEEALVDNAADVKQVKKGGKREKRRRQQDLQDIKKIVSTVEGQRFFMRYFRICRVWQTTWSPDNQIYFNEGKRVIGLTMFNDLRSAAPDMLLNMMTLGEVGLRDEKGLKDE